VLASLYNTRQPRGSGCLFFPLILATLVVFAWGGKVGDFADSVDKRKSWSYVGPDAKRGGEGWRDGFYFLWM
jgi:hypothetical protein